jgi:PAS domain S-box-containing protein
MTRGDHAATLFVGDGEMAARCRDFDWAATPLGPVETWSQSLRTMASAVLASRNPMLLFWGPDLVQFYNDAFRPSLGFAAGPAARHPRALGMRAADFWTDVWEVVGPQIHGVMTRGEAVWFENLHLPIERDGRMDDAWWTYSYSPVRDDDGRIGGTLVVCLETTSAVKARMEIERERARSADILEAMGDAHFALDRDFRIVSANRTMVRNVGLSREEMIGRSVWEVFPGLQGGPFEQAYRRAIVEGVSGHVTHHYGDDRLDLVADVDAYPTPEGGVAIFWRDVTERERVEAERAHALAEAERARQAAEIARAEAEAARRAAELANRAKSEFLAVMSHELRTPLNAIGGYAELMEIGIHGAVSAEQHTALERIQRSQRHLLGLINGVLNYAKVDAGAVHYEIQDITMDEVLTTCEALTAPQVRARGLVLVYAGCTCEPGLTVRADREKLQQIVLNLLSNAVKFTEPGGRIVMECAPLDDDRVEVRVSDTGVGIAPDRLEAVFQPFVQVDSALTRTNEGVGLGLAISRDLARGMGGDLTAESTPGRGSTFTLVLPRR